MLKLNLPLYDLKTRVEGTTTFVYDEFRKKWIKLSNEEWVRQQFLQYLCNYLGYPHSLIAVEKEIKYNQTSRRFDAVVFSTLGDPIVIIEFKSPDVNITQKTLNQVAVYCYVVKVKYIFLTNGLQHYALKVENNKVEFLDCIPEFSKLV